jgi:HEAT repeat protein
MIVRTVRLVLAVVVFCVSLTLTIAQQAKTPQQNTPETRVLRLIAIVESPDSPDRDLAIRTLAEMKAKAAPAVPVLCTVLSDRQHGTRALAVDALVAIGGASVKPLREQLDSPLGRFRAAAATALVRLEQLQPQEIRQLAQDGDPRVRATAANAFNRSGAADISQLVAMLSDSEPAVAVEAARSLQINQNDPSVAIPGLIKSLPRKHVGRAAADALGSYGVRAQRAIPWIIKAYPLGKSRRFDLRDASEDALQHIGPPHEDDIPLSMTETRHPTFVGDVRKLVKIPKSMGFPVDAVRLKNQGVWFFGFFGAG